MNTVSLFCGAGGESAGKNIALRAAGISPDVSIAINHWDLAVQVHSANFPGVRVYQEDITRVSADDYGLDHISLLWASPSCVHHSRARGGKPREEQQRAHALEVLDRWVRRARVDVLLIENVPEFEDWGPLDDDGQPIKERKGEDFQSFVSELRAMGYFVEWRVLCAADYGDPTTRRRFFLQAVRDGVPISWPAPTHRSPRATRGLFDDDLPTWRTAAECIDWTIPVPSIFVRKKPLADNTMRRIAAGVNRYVLHGEPFLANIPGGPAAVSLIQYHATQAGGRERGQGIDDPLQTVDTSNRYAMVAAFLAKHYGGVVGSSLAKPMGTVTAVDHHSLVAATLVQTGYGERPGQAPRALNIRDPLGTVVGAGQKHALVAAFLTHYYGTAIGSPLSEPMDTITTLARHGLVTVEIDGETYAIVDIGLRMLEPHELAAAMSFPPEFRFERTDGSPLSKAAAVKMIGNACPVRTVASLVLEVLRPRADRYRSVA